MEESRKRPGRIKPERIYSRREKMESPERRGRGNESLNRGVKSFTVAFLVLAKKKVKDY